MTKEELKNYLIEEAEHERSEVNSMTPKEMVDAYLVWNGIINYTDDIIDVVNAAFGNDESHFERCVEYIKEHLEHWEIEQGWDYIGKRMGLPNELEGRIYDLIDEYTEDNDLTDDWWNDYDVEDFFLEIENN